MCGWRRSPNPMTELGWKSVGVLELTSLPSIDKDRWVSWVRETDVLLVNGGDALYLCHWMRESGLGGLLPSLRDTVYIGLSAGSMVLTPRIGEKYAIDDQTAIKVTGSSVEVISEGRWKLFNPAG